MRARPLRVVMTGCGGYAAGNYEPWLTREAKPFTGQGRQGVDMREASTPCHEEIG